MVIDMRLIPEGHSSIERDSVLEAFAHDLPPFDRPVRCRAEIDRMGGTTVAMVRFDGVFNIQCVRCLEDYGEPLRGELRVIIKEEQGRHGPSLDDDSADFFYDVNHDLVDISPAIYDEIMTSLPIKPLCSEGCEGIKIESGVTDDAIDPRWEGLKQLKHSK
ncbi:MAG: DUF177 domain-containing protein [Chitinispirillales bacterium]|jgi:uncharacterized protein|nr:DUF177 domain-containing protein [Chitinispirillales bacterium]